MAERTGDPFRAFYDRALPEVYGYLLTRLGDASRAEVATAETFDGVVPQWPLPANVKFEVAFAVGLARHRLADEYRRQDQHVKRRRRYAAMRSSAAAHRTTAAVDRRVHWAMVALPAMQRAAMVLRHVDGLSVREVAAILGRGSRVAEFLLLRGSRTLHRALKEVAQTDGFDPLVAMMGLDGPVEPPEEFKEDLYDELRAQLDQSAVGAPRSEELSRPVLHKVFLVAAISLGAILLLAGWLRQSEESTEQPPTIVEPRPLSEPDVPGDSPGPAVTTPTTSRAPFVEPIRHPARSLGGYQFGGWRVLPASEFDGRAGAAVAWTGEQLIVWGGERGSDLTSTSSYRGGVLDPGANVWFSLPPAPMAPRSGATALWTGTEVVVIGGDSPDAAAYDPATRLWRALPVAPILGAPDDVAVWTGTEVILFGGRGGDGLALNVAGNTWRSLPDAPNLEWENTSGLWTGTEMIVWDDPVRAGGGAANVAAYESAANSWRQPDGPDEPIELAGVAGVWTGEEVILWGIDVSVRAGTDADPVYAGLALNVVTDEWRTIAPPPALEFFGRPEESSVVWTGGRMLVWRQAPLSEAANPEIWAYDPVADAWERGASSPVASNPSLIWADDVLYAYGGGDRLFRTLSLDLGPDADDLPAPVGAQAEIDGPSLPFELLAIDSSTRRAAVLDLARSVAIVYEASENLLPADAIAGGAPAGNGWITSANGAVWSFPNGVASQPFVMQSGPTMERPGLAPEVYLLTARGDQYSGWMWIVENGTGTLDDPTLVRQLSLDSGWAITTATVPGRAYPVASTAAGLLLNVDSDRNRDSVVPEMALVALDGSVRELWPGWGLGLSSLGQVTWLECDDGENTCRVVVSALDGPSSGDLVVGEEEATFGATFQPGVSQVSPDGAWLVTTRVSPVNVDALPSVVLVNLHDGSVRELPTQGTLGAQPGPSVVWSMESDWVLMVGGPTAFRVADGFTVDLGDVVPDEMRVYAVASR